ncbi:MAG: ABC transporter substrate-binding protein [Anaerolineae bacterium]|nr:ABC transporter substrate-binding protein [Thermoflexus sp.]MCS7350568.1 ABC transporter substrate-binding protein [Thermoflexus sp.]MDW8180019.1 ABC transporter substrate-binding protein [Anaerolineae bacterium]
MKVEAPDCNYGGEFKAIEAIDQYTVRFTLCYPDPAFPSKVAFAAFAIQDKDYLDANGGDSVKMSERPNGTGPYRVKEWIRGDRIIFEANPDYWGEKAKAKTLIFRWSKEAAARLLELQAGTVDGIDNPNPNDFATIERDPNLKLYIRPPLNIAYLGLNNTKPPLDNEKVRQAIAMAIDRERLVKNFYPAGSMVAEQFVPPALKPGYTEGLKWYDYNPEEAKRLLAEAGYPNGFDITLSYRDVVRGYLPEPGKVAQDLQAQLAEVGIRVEIKVMESGAFLDSVAAGNEPMYLLGWLADYPDATNFYDYHFANEANKQFGNLFPDLVQEIRAAAKLSDPAERQKHYDKVNELIKRHVPMIPLAHGVSAAAFKASVKGAHASPLNNEAFWVMDPGKDELVWMQNAEPIALWCADETDGETFRACQQVYEPLLTYKVGGVEVEPALAERYEANADLTVWTFYLRRGVKFHNGAELDANDVVATFKAQWDAKDPNHKGRTGTFEYFSAFFGAFLNAQQ